MKAAKRPSRPTAKPIAGPVDERVDDRIDIERVRRPMPTGGVYRTVFLFSHAHRDCAPRPNSVRRQNLLGRFKQIPRLLEEVKAIQDLLDSIRREGPDLLDQLLLIEGIDLGHVDDAALRQIRLPEIQ